MGDGKKVLGRGLQALFERRLKVQDQFDKTLETLKEARKIIEETKRDGFDVTEAQKLFNQAETPLREKNYADAIKYANKAKEAALMARENLFKAEEAAKAEPLALNIDTKRADDAINRTRKIIEELKSEGIEVSHIQMLLAQAQEFFEDHEYDEMEGCALEAEAYAEFVKKIEHSR
jgi:tetratricopeptide (TPR) repeat protein